MNRITLTCAILHTDAQLVTRLAEHISQMPYLVLTGTYSNPLDALGEYYKQKVNLYFVGICSASGRDGIDSMDFCRFLSPETRVVFIALDGQYAAECFRLDALDYLTTVDFSCLLQSVGKAMRWFSRQDAGELEAVHPVEKEVGAENRTILVRSDSRILRLKLSKINYLEGMGDYVKIHTCEVAKPVLTLCNLKSMEERLLADMFVRIHRSFIVNMRNVSVIERGEVVVGGKALSVGDAYRDRLKQYVARLTVM